MTCTGERRFATWAVFGNFQVAIVQEEVLCAGIVHNCSLIPCGEDVYSASHGVYDAF
jgi:hypothetical protein